MKRLVLGIISSVFIFNTLSAFPMDLSQSRDLVSEAISVQGDVLSYFASINLPIEIVNRLFAQEGTSDRTRSEKKDKKENSSADNQNFINISILKSQKKLEKSADLCPSRICHNPGIFLIQTAKIIFIHTQAFHFSYLILFMLLFIIILSLINLPGSVITKSIENLKPGLIKAGFFIFKQKKIIVLWEKGR